MTIESMWNSYANCWSASDAVRSESLSTSVADDVHYRDPQQEARGRVALSEAMATFASHFPGGRFAIGRVRTHHRRSLAEWKLVQPDGAVVMTGTSAAIHADDDRFLEINGFFDGPAGDE